ncbi:MAG: hypothetical protein O2826_12220 [Chloroflexi bacterium]|nr:hypothetical protein [Chloroflexota bacterium]MDA1175263.1 hypothetical protein [Chloroflexota bacterium]
MATSDQGQTQELGADDVLAAVAASQQALGTALDRDWEVLAGTLEWTCRRTLDHLIDGAVFYSCQVANEATKRLPPIRMGNPDASVEDLLTTIGSVAHILASTLRSASPEGRAFHPAGMADRTGFAAMSCVELLVHTFDIASGLGIEFAAPQELCERVIRRLSPWITELGPDAFATLLWSTGRVAIEGQDDVASDWYWQCAPLSEWDGTVRKRPAAPGAPAAAPAR